MSAKLVNSLSTVKSAASKTLEVNESPMVMGGSSMAVTVLKKNAKDLESTSSGGTGFKGLGGAVQSNNSDKAVGVEVSTLLLSLCLLRV